MTTPRQAALERLYGALNEVPDGMYPEPLAWEKIKAAYVTVEHAAPEPETCPKNCTTFQQYGNCDHLGRDLADARAAIREAAAYVRANHYCANPAMCRMCRWLALPAVVAALKEGKG